METRLPPDFRDFLALLNSENVEYLIVGGYAVSYHGYPRPTGDLDIWIAVNADNARRMKAVLSRFGFPSDPASPDELMVPNKVFRMGVPPVRIEVLTGVTGVHFADCQARSVEAVLDGVKVWLIGRDDLLANKRAAGRHKDLNDVERLTGGEHNGEGTTS